MTGGFLPYVNVDGIWIAARKIPSDWLYGASQGSFWGYMVPLGLRVFLERNQHMVIHIIRLKGNIHVAHAVFSIKHTADKIQSIGNRICCETLCH